MKEKAIKKINSMGKIAGIFTRIAQVLTVIGFVGCLVGIIALAIIPEGFIKLKTTMNADIVVDMSAVNYHFTDENRDEIAANLKEQVTSGNITINGQHFGNADIDLVGDSFVVTAEGQIQELSLKKLIPAIIAGALNIVCAFITLTFVGFLCRAFKNCQNPFEDDVIKSMRNLAISIIPWAFMSSVSEAVVTASFLRNGDFRINADFTVIVTVLIIFGLTYVFKYGAMLQQESDETL